MLTVISPAKTLDMASAVPARRWTQPRMLDDSEQLVEHARKLGATKLESLMGVSAKIATENAARFKAWARPMRGDGAAPAVFAFRGDVYRGLDADTLSPADLDFAQSHLRMLSGLYGLLRPCDMMKAYRLEMGLPMKVGKARSLYEFWGDRITLQINKDLKAAKTDVLVNLASNEYARAIDRNVLKARVITPVFKELRNGKLKIISFSAKKARGIMARFLIDGRLTDPAALKKFRRDGYRFDAKGSTDDELLFVRPGP